MDESPCEQIAMTWFFWTPFERATALTCGLVDVTLDVDRSMTDTVPGDRVSGSGSGNGSGFIPVLAAAMHFTDRLIAAAVGNPGCTTTGGPVDVGVFAPSYWYNGLQTIGNVELGPW